MDSGFHGAMHGVTVALISVPIFMPAPAHLRQTDVRHRPHSLSGHSAAKTRVNALLGPPSSSFPHPTLPFPHNVRERSAERRWVTSGTLRRRRVPCDRHARLPALHCGYFSPRSRTSGEGPGARGPTCHLRLPPPSFRSRVQPLKADPRSRAGRPPEAPRSGDCESQAAGTTPCSTSMTPHDSALT